MSYNKIYFLKNFETEKTLTFSETNITLEELKSYNEKGWNIYESVNTFIGNDRKSENIAEIKSCFIDIDYPEILNMDEKERASFLKEKYNTIKQNFKVIKDKYGLTPSIVNLTYKGFHILYKYEENLYLISEKCHLIINNELNEILGGDENARDISRVFKTVGFIDWKGGKKGIIKNLLLKNTNLGNISKDIITFNFDIKLKVRNQEKLQSKISSAGKKIENLNIGIEKINSFDAIYFVEQLKSYFDSIINSDFSLEEKEIILNKLKYKKEKEGNFKFFESDGKTSTAGLLIEKNKKGLYEINDYSKKNRRGNYNFLKNWILKDTKTGQNKLQQILYKTLNLTTNSSSKILMDGKLMWDLFNDRLELDEENVSVLTNHNKKILDSFKENYFKVFIGLFSYIKIQLDNNNLKMSQDGFYEIEWIDFMKSMYGIYKKDDIKNHRPIVKEILLGISNLKIAIASKTITSSGKIVETADFKNFLSVKFETGVGGRGNKSLFFIKPSISEKFIFSQSLGIKSFKILNHQKGFTNLYSTSFHDKIYTVINNTKNLVYIESFENCFKTLNLTTENLTVKLRTLKKHLTDGVEKGYYGDFLIDKNNNTIKVFKYKQSK